MPGHGTNHWQPVALAARGLGKYLLKQDRFLLAPELEVESDAGESRHGNFKFDGLDLMLVEPDPHFVHGLGERVFGLFDADRKGGD